MITLQFSALAGIASRLIEYYGHDAYAHVDTVMPDGSLLGARCDVMAGVPAGVQIRPAGYAPFTAVRLVHIPATDDQTATYLAFLRGQIGKPYDMRAIVGFAVGRPWRDPGAWICSELVAAGLEAAGVFRWPLALEVSKIDPGDLLLACSVLVDLAA